MYLFDLILGYHSSAFTKALTCIARYGDELTLHATSQDLALSATNSSKSAYARFKYDRTFFQKYALDQQAEDEEVTGQLLVKVWDHLQFVTSAHLL